MINDIRWSEHSLYADVVKRVPPELHPTVARAVDLWAADAWLHEGTMPAGLDSDGQSLGGQQGPAFLRAAGRCYMRRWVTDEHGEQFGKGETGMLLDKWIDEMVAFSAGPGGRGRGISWLPGRVEEVHVLVDSRSGEPPTYRYYTVREICESKALAHFLGLYARRRRHKTHERIERACEDERIPLNRKAREMLGIHGNCARETQEFWPRNARRTEASRHRDTGIRHFRKHHKNRDRGTRRRDSEPGTATGWASLTSEGRVASRRSAGLCCGPQ